MIADMTPPAFEEFPKIFRWSRDIIVTEKIDGSNASVHVFEDGSILAGSRTRYITPATDNFGFAAWVKANEEQLRPLGPGRHFGEWWGSGIQRGYGLSEKRFSLFNVSRWADDSLRPACCQVVPVLYRGPMNEVEIFCALQALKGTGSLAAPGFMKAEGLVIFHVPSGALFKKTIEKDEEPKNFVRAARATEVA